MGVKSKALLQGLSVAGAVAQSTTRAGFLARELTILDNLAFRRLVSNAYKKSRERNKRIFSDFRSCVVRFFEQFMLVV